jgi:hypothetical protein
MKDTWEKVKAFLIYIATPFAFVLGFTYYLLTKNQELKNKLNQSEAEKKINELETRKEAIDEKASDAVSNYESARDEYYKGRDNN